MLPRWNPCFSLLVAFVVCLAACSEQDDDDDDKGNGEEVLNAQQLCRAYREEMLDCLSDADFPTDGLESMWEGQCADIEPDDSNAIQVFRCRRRALAESACDDFSNITEEVLDGCEAS